MMLEDSTEAALRAAIATAAPGDVLRLPEGEIRLGDELRFTRGLRLVGAGAARTRLTRLRAPRCRVATAALPAGEALRLEGLTLAYADDGLDRAGEYLFESDALAVEAGRVELADCWLWGSRREWERSPEPYGGAGLRLTGQAVVHAERCEIRWHGGHGVALAGRAALELADCWIAGNRGLGLYAADEARVLARGTGICEHGRGGLATSGRVALELAGVALTGNRRFGARLAGSGACRLTACEIEENGGPGLELLDGELALAGGLVRRNAGSGLLVADGARLVAEGASIEANGGFGVEAAARASVELGRSALIGNHRGRTGRPDV